MVPYGHPGRERVNLMILARYIYIYIYIYKMFFWSLCDVIVLEYSIDTLRLSSSSVGKLCHVFNVMEVLFGNQESVFLVSSKIICVSTKDYCITGRANPIFCAVGLR